MKMKNSLAWLSMAAIALSVAQVRADTIDYNAGNNPYDLENYATGSTFQDASLAYIADAGNFGDSSGSSLSSWNKNDGSDGEYFHGARSWEWNTSAAGGEISWILTGLTPGQEYKLAIAGLLNDQVPLPGENDTRYFDVGTTSGSLSSFYIINASGTATLPAGSVAAYDGSNAKYSSYIVPFEDSIVADASGELTVYFASRTRATGSYRSHIDGMVISPIPEPATLGMVAVFGGGILFIRRRLRFF